SPPLEGTTSGFSVTTGSAAAAAATRSGCGIDTSALESDNHLAPTSKPAANISNTTTSSDTTMTLRRTVRVADDATRPAETIMKAMLETPAPPNTHANACSDR